MRRIVFDKKKKTGLKFLSVVVCITALAFTACSKDYDDDISDLQKQITEQSTVISSLQAQLTTLNGELEKTNANLATAQSELTIAIESAKADAAKNDEVILAAAKAAAAEAQANAIAEAAQKVAELKESLEAEIAQKASKQELKDAIAAVEAAHKADIEALKAEIVAINKSLDKLNTDLNDFKTAQTATNKDLQNQITTNENAIALLDAAYKAADSDLQAKIDVINEALKTLNETTIPNIQKDILENASNIDDLKKQMKAAQDSIKALDDKLDAINTELGNKISSLDTKLSGEIATLNVLVTVRPTSMVFKPMNYRNGIEALVFEPVRYLTKQNKENTAVTADEGIDFYKTLDFIENDTKPYENIATKWISLYGHYVKMPAEVNYYINPSGTTIDVIDIDKAKFYGNYATTRSSDDSEDVGNVLSLNYNSHFKPVVENNTLKFRVNALGGITTDYYKDFGWTYASNKDNYTGRVDTTTVWQTQAYNLQNGYAGTDRGYSYVFATNIPLKDAALADGETSADIFSDYAVVTSEEIFAAFYINNGKNINSIYNVHKKNAYELTGTAVGQQKPSYTGIKNTALNSYDPTANNYTVTEDNGRIYTGNHPNRNVNVIYDLYNAEGKGFDPEAKEKLCNYVGLVEINKDYHDGDRFTQVSKMRMEDYGFEYRFYVPTFAGVASADKKHDGTAVNKYKGPHYGPYEYYFGASKTDFQDYMTLDAKTGAITVKDWEKTSKGFAPIVLCQVVDTRRPNTPVVTESYFRVVIKGIEVEKRFEKTDFPRCNNDTVLVVCPYNWLKTNIYDKFNITREKFINYFEPKLTKKATASTEEKWLRITQKNKSDNETLDLCVSIPYDELTGLKDDILKSFASTIEGKLSGNIVTINFTANMGLPKIEMTYQDAYWIDYSDCNTMVGNPRPFSDLTYKDRASYDLNLLTGFNTAKSPGSQYAQDKKSGIYYSATFNGKSVTSSIKDCFQLDIQPVFFHNGAYTGANSKYYYNHDINGSVENTYLKLLKAYNAKMKNFDYSHYYNKTAAYDAFQYRTSGGLFGDYNIQLTETPSTQPNINTIAGSDAAIKLLADDAIVPAQVIATYPHNSFDKRVIKEFKLVYEQPIYLDKANTQYEIVDINHQKQSIPVREIIKLKDWRGNEVAPYAVAAAGTTGVPNPEALSYYYNVQNPYFEHKETLLNVRTNLTIDVEKGNLVPDTTGKVMDGPLPDGVTVVELNPGTLNSELVYQNSGKELDSDYIMYIDVEIEHKWGKIVLSADPNKYGKAASQQNPPVTIVVKANR